MSARNFTPWIHVKDAMIRLQCLLWMVCRAELVLSRHRSQALAPSLRYWIFAAPGY